MWKTMTGEIGKLSLNGEQVGGFRNWTAITKITTPVKSHVIASGFWMLKKATTNKLDAEFYAEDAGVLQLVSRGEVFVNLPPDYAIDTLILKSIKITFEEDFDWRK